MSNSKSVQFSLFKCKKWFYHMTTCLPRATYQVRISLYYTHILITFRYATCFSRGFLGYSNFKLK